MLVPVAQPTHLQRAKILEPVIPLSPDRLRIPKAHIERVSKFLTENPDKLPISIARGVSMKGFVQFCTTYRPMPSPSQSNPMDGRAQLSLWLLSVPQSHALTKWVWPSLANSGIQLLRFAVNSAARSIREKLAMPTKSEGSLHEPCRPRDMAAHEIWRYRPRTKVSYV